MNLLYQSYKNNNNLGSITEITAKKLLDSINGKRIDLITYSFPCQDLSVAGSFHGFNQGMAKELNNRSGLLWEIERILKELKKTKKLPKFLLLENVPNMISERHKTQYILWKKALKKMGYFTKTYKLSAMEYGIPQSRTRIFAISVLNLNKFEVSKDAFINDEYEEKNFLKEAASFDKLSKLKSKNLKHIIKNDWDTQELIDEAISCIPNNTPSRQKMYKVSRHLNDFKKPNSYTTFVKRYGDHVIETIKYGYTRTLTTKQDRNPCSGIVVFNEATVKKFKLKKSKFRFITPREAFLLMGFGESDYVKCKNTELFSNEMFYKITGNSIVVNVLIYIMAYIHELNVSLEGDK